MFPEYRELITQLNADDPHFHQLFKKHADLDQRIRNMEAHVEPSSPEEIEILKKRKLWMKDELYDYLKKASESQ